MRSWRYRSEPPTIRHPHGAVLRGRRVGAHSPGLRGDCSECSAPGRSIVPVPREVRV